MLSGSQPDSNSGLERAPHKFLLSSLSPLQDHNVWVHDQSSEREGGLAGAYDSPLATILQTITEVRRSKCEDQVTIAELSRPPCAPEYCNRVVLSLDLGITLWFTLIASHICLQRHCFSSC